jgi:hypothetical protein
MHMHVHDTYIEVILPRDGIGSRHRRRAQQRRRNKKKAPEKRRGHCHCYLDILADLVLVMTMEALEFSIYTREWR